MKKCMLCGWEESDEATFTCPACGEATWAEFKPVEEDAALPPVKRGPGRPRKQA